MSAPEPNSPEALRAAQKVRNVFYMIAAANLLLIAIVMWPRGSAPANRGTSIPAAAPSPADPAVAEMAAVQDRLLAAYHGRDAERFSEVFSASAIPRPDEEYFRTVIIGQFHEQFGDVLDQRTTVGTNSDPDGGVLVSELTTEKGGRAKSVVKFRRENGSLRVLEWRLEKLGA